MPIEQGTGNPTEEPVPVPAIPPRAAARLRARVLDPATAPQFPGQRIQPTVYVADQLLVRGMPGGLADLATSALDELAAKAQLGIRFEPDDRDVVARRRYGSLTPEIDEAYTTRLTIIPTDPGLAVPVDAWSILQQLRAVDAEALATVSLCHILTACSGPWGGAGGYWGGVGGYWGGVGGYWGGVGGYWGGVGGGVAAYGAPGLGGRTPVVWSAPNPRDGAAAVDRPPVVAIVDTGLGRHPWFFDTNGDPVGVELPVTVDPTTPGSAAIGLRPAADEDPTGVSDLLAGLVDTESGHGTFIAGIVRQRCPQAVILPVAVMDADGVADEKTIVDALADLLARQLAARDRKDGSGIDVINLSMGFYHETPADSTGPLAHVLRALVDAGVVVVAAAGNDATSARFLPAAFAADGLAILSVGALNPDGETVALFSNNGAWITHHAVGAAVVSTVPVTLSGAYGRSIDVARTDPLPRTTPDPDDYRSGFAIWSGTSFAAPRVAGDVAARIVAAQQGGC